MPTRVDLREGSAASAGERDVVASFERARTGSGPDVLLGGPGAEVLAGGAGSDVIDGGDVREPPRNDGGSYLPVLEPGRDVLDGGPGNDRLAASRDRWADAATCGDGLDQGDADTFDRFDPSCEAVTRRPLESLFRRHRMEHDAVVRVTGGRAVVVTPCAFPGIGGTVELRRGGRVLGRRSWTCRPNPDLRLLEPTRLLGIRLPGDVRRLLRRTRRLRVTALMGWADGSRRSRDRVRLVLRRVTQ